jgi:hypothetical protein
MHGPDVRCLVGSHAPCGTLVAGRGFGEVRGVLAYLLAPVSWRPAETVDRARLICRSTRPCMS